MKRIICVIITMVFLLTSFSAAYAHGYTGVNGWGGYDFEKNIKGLKEELKKYSRNLDKRKDLLKNISELKKKYKDYSVIIIINGEELILDTAPVLKDKYSKMLVPIAPIVRALGYSVSWDQKNSRLTIKNDDLTLILKVGSDIAEINGKQVKLDDKVIIKNGRVMAPIGLLGKILKNRIEIDDDSGAVIIDEEDILTLNDNATGTGINRFDFSEGWKYGRQQGAYMDDNHWSDIKGENYRVRFSGTQIKLYGAKAANHGIASVSIDNGPAVKVDFYSSTRKDNELLYTSPVLENGQHTLTVTVTGTKNSKSKGKAVTADRVDIISSGISTNLALGKTYAASSISGRNYAADNAFDGNTGTRWSSTDSDPQWISVDLGEVKRINRVKLYWESAYAKAYRIEVSDNAKNWTAVYSTEDGDGGLDDITFSPTEARYVRMYGTERKNKISGWGYSLYEFEVYSDSGAAIPASGTYEAEEASLSGGAEEDDRYSGYSGSGYVTSLEDSGSRVRFDVNAEEAGEYRLTIRYSNGNSARRTLTLYGNGDKVGQVSFPRTSNWNTWADRVEYLELDKGKNTVMLRYDNGDTGDVNIDYIKLEAASRGSLTGSVEEVKGKVKLSDEGTLDWAHWGYGGIDGFNRKRGVEQQISDYTILGGGTPAFVSGAANPVKYAWTGGTPKQEVTETSTSIYLSGEDSGFSITVPADTTQRTLRLYVGAWDSRVKLEAYLSGSEGLSYEKEFKAENGVNCKVFTLNYKADTKDQTLTVKYRVLDVYSENFGNITLQAATLK